MPNSMKVVKFGGSSLANAGQIRKVVEIIKQDPKRRYVVVSAPGKRFSEDTKVTDLLITCYEQAVRKQDYTNTLSIIANRFKEMASELGVVFDVEDEMAELRSHLKNHPEKAYVVSRGEYLNAKLIARVLHFPFVDAKDMIYLDCHQHLIANRSYDAVARTLRDVPSAVIGGFYGSDETGHIMTFSRGGSDVTGAVIARGLHAEIYENWTDVNGFYSVDPRVVKDARRIDWISYRELRELSYMGASVLHEDAVFPIRELGIPLNIRNTNEPDNPGTMITSGDNHALKNRVIAGVAGKKGLSNLQVEKAMMNNEVGFGAKLLQIIADHNVSYEHTPTSIDTISVLVSTQEIETHRLQIMREIQNHLKPDHLSLEDGIAVVAVVGEGMAHSYGIAARLFTVLAQAEINIRMIDLGFSEMTIIIGISEKDYEKALRVIYEGMQNYF